MTGLARVGGRVTQPERRSPPLGRRNPGPGPPAPRPRPGRAGLAAATWVVVGPARRSVAARLVGAGLPIGGPAGCTGTAPTGTPGRLLIAGRTDPIGGAGRSRPLARPRPLAAQVDDHPSGDFDHQGVQVDE